MWKVNSAPARASTTAPAAYLPQASFFPQMVSGGFSWLTTIHVEIEKVKELHPHQLQYDIRVRRGVLKFCTESSSNPSKGEVANISGGDKIFFKIKLN